MNTMEMMLLLQAGVEPRILREVEIATRLAQAVRAADKRVRDAMKGQEGDDKTSAHAIELAARVGRMF